MMKTHKMKIDLMRIRVNVEAIIRQTTWLTTEMKYNDDADRERKRLLIP
jgi:hypothetical protein